MRLIKSLAFYRQSLRIQHLHAELFHNATALRGINGPEDVKKMPGSQRELALRSIEIAREGLDITVNSTSYREGMKYGMGVVSKTFRIDLLSSSRPLYTCHCDVRRVLLVAPRSPFVSKSHFYVISSDYPLPAPTFVTSTKFGIRLNDLLTCSVTVSSE